MQEQLKERQRELQRDEDRIKRQIKVWKDLQVIAASAPCPSLSSLSPLLLLVPHHDCGDDVRVNDGHSIYLT